MTSHELARKLLAGPNMEVKMKTSFGDREITDVFIEDKYHCCLFHNEVFEWESKGLNKIPVTAKNKFNMKEYVELIELENDDPMVYIIG